MDEKTEIGTRKWDLNGGKTMRQKHTLGELIGMRTGRK